MVNIVPVWLPCSLVPTVISVYFVADWTGWTGSCCCSTRRCGKKRRSISTTPWRTTCSWVWSPSSSLLKLWRLWNKTIKYTCRCSRNLDLTYVYMSSVDVICLVGCYMCVTFGVVCQFECHVSGWMLSVLSCVSAWCHVCQSVCHHFGCHMHQQWWPKSNNSRNQSLSYFWGGLYSGCIYCMVLILGWSEFLGTCSFNPTKYT